ncbi:integrase catalytic subunit [Caballeronia arvi]|uniref:Integrase catalytic subunit n=1 Tax=Caballeronia arvi TaxID=1777135 RepID=A0A158KXK6_9BURK|nr:helix-turn-helix domain-containing protein [Caballeronia arvi]SAL85886.1 integrase catalytic subunit [Caballeronia arvi]
MSEIETITMSMREVDRVKVIEAVVDGRLMTWRAAERLGMSRRQVERLASRYRAEGAAGLVSKRRGKPSNHQLPEDTICRALALIHERYADFGPTLACEKLVECHGIGLAKETVRQLMIDAGLWVPQRDTLENRKLIGRYIEVWEYPDGRKEIRANGKLIASRAYDRLAEVDQGAIVEHKRLAHVLEISQAIQAERDNRRIGKAPSRAHRGAGVKTHERVPGTKKQRELTQADVEQVIVQMSSHKNMKSTAENPSDRSVQASDINAGALPDHMQSFDTTLLQPRKKRNRSPRNRDIST